MKTPLPEGGGPLMMRQRILADVGTLAEAALQTLAVAVASRPLDAGESPHPYSQLEQRLI